MNLKILIYSILSAIIIFILFQLINKPNPITLLDSINLAGNTYVEERDNLIIYEKWLRVSGSTLEGSSIYIDKESNDTTFKEELRIVEMLGEVYYIACIGSNDNLVSFKLQGDDKNNDNSNNSNNDQKYMFLNPEHDFPKYINYTIRNDSLIVVIGDNTKSSTFRFKKSN